MKKILILAVLLMATTSFADIIYEKLDDNTLKIKSTITTEASIEYGALVKKRDKYAEALTKLRAQYDAEIARMQLVLDELNKQVTEAGKLGIVEKPAPVEETVIEEVE